MRGILASVVPGIVRPVPRATSRTVFETIIFASISLSVYTVTGFFDATFSSGWQGAT